MKRRARFEQAVGLPVTAFSGRKIDIKENQGRQKADIWTDVLLPALALGAGVFAVPIGAGLVWYAWETGHWLPAVVGIGCASGGLAFAAAVVVQMAHYRELKQPAVEWTIGAEPAREREPAARLIFRDPAEPARMTVSGRAWDEAELSRLAKATHGRDGRWNAPRRLTRDFLRGVIPDVSRPAVYRQVLDDLQAWGWIDDDNLWTAQGMEALDRRFLNVRESPHPDDRVL